MLTRAGQRFTNFSVATALAIGALQMFRVHGGIVTDYGADLFGVAWVYALTRTGRTIVQRGRPTSAAGAALVVFGLSVAWELGQRMRLIPGTYDRYDILTYAIAALLCWLVDVRAPLIAAPDSSSSRAV
jgi:hypothetical protein